MNEKKCIICNEDLKFIIKRKDKYSYYSCKVCNLITCFPKPTENEIKEYYTGFLHEESDEGKAFEIRKKRVENDVKKIVRDIKKIKKLKNKELTLLDFGGGVGFYPNGFAKQEFKVTLFEIDKTSIDFAKKHFNNFKIKTKLSNKDKFDIVYCNHVIEHSRTPDLFLKKLKKHLKKNGLLIITTPNQSCKEFYFRPTWFYYYIQNITGKKISKIPNAINKFIKNPWVCCDPPRHLYSFNKLNIKKLLKKENLTPLRIFTEYSTSQYYTLKFNCNLKIKRPQDIFKFFHNVYAILGIGILNFLDINNNLGNGLVAYAKNG
tara:strand:- start:11839 stop:12795 length:957 start_codon:yes stop_codon:yes gene_type:complete